MIIKISYIFQCDGVLYREKKRLSFGKKLSLFCLGLFKPKKGLVFVGLFKPKKGLVLEETNINN